MFKKDFPIFENNPGVVFLDSTASTQKPKYVIDGIKHFLENDYANIHRGSYDLSERSEELYHKSKEKVKEFINARDVSEINYTYNSTYALNLLTGSLRRSNYFKKGDKVLLSIAEHHANVVPWFILKEDIGIEIEFVNIDENYLLDYDDLISKLDGNVKVVSLTYVSNVTGSIFDLKKVSNILDEKYTSDNKPLFVVDGSQSVPNFKTDVQDINCDFMFFTGHKIMAETGIGVLYGKKELLKKLTPVFGGGGAINFVKSDCYQPAGLPYRFEPGTPNIIGAVSLLRALEYVESIGGYDAIIKNEEELINYTIQKINEIEKKSGKIQLIGNKNSKKRVGIFSFVIENAHMGDLADIMAENNIAIRAGHHCAEPFANKLGINGSLRMSLYIYNEKQDIDKFFDVLSKLI